MSKTNKMSLGQLTLVTAVNMIGAGIIMLPSQLAQVGAVSVFAWIISTVGAMSLAYAFAKCGLYSKKGGGLGGYAEYSFGKSGNFLVNFTYAISLPQSVPGLESARQRTNYLTRYRSNGLRQNYLTCKSRELLWWKPPSLSD